MGLPREGGGGDRVGRSAARARRGEARIVLPLPRIAGFEDGARDETAKDKKGIFMKSQGNMRRSRRLAPLLIVLLAGAYGCETQAPSSSSPSALPPAHPAVK